MPCAICGRPDDVAWLGGYELGEHMVCVRCYEKLPLETPDDWRGDWQGDEEAGA